MTEEEALRQYASQVIATLRAAKERCQNLGRIDNAKALAFDITTIERALARQPFDPLGQMRSWLVALETVANGFLRMTKQ